MNLPFSDANPQAATRKPKMAVNFSSAADSGGAGLLDSVSSVASAVGIDLSSEAVDPWQRSLAEITSHSCLAPRVDQAILMLADDNQSPEFKIGDSGDIQLGYEDDQLYPVFTGEITSVKIGIDHKAVLTVCNGAFKLSQQRSNQSFEQLSAGDIVEELADLAGVETDVIESGIDFPFYVIDDGKNLYQHIALLAEKSGLIAFISAANKLNFATPESGQATRTFNYGADLIRINVINTTPTVDQLTVVGAGAAGSQGSDAWNWLVKDPQSITATAGEGKNSRIVTDAGLRSTEAVQQAAAGKLFYAHQRSSKASLTVVGAAEIIAGSKIEIAGVPQDTLNGSAIVESARHQYSKHKGFITELDVLMETGEGLGSSLSGALGGLL